MKKFIVFTTKLFRLAHADGNGGSQPEVALTHRRQGARNHRESARQVGILDCQLNSETVQESSTMRRLTLFLLTTVLLISLFAAAVTAQQVHVVQRGENLYQIARNYDRTVEELARANGISPPYIIHAGNEMSIPAQGGAAQAQTQSPKTTTASPETHCYIIGDVCVIISNVCYLETIDCGDGTDWFSKRAWLRGWCMAAIHAGVIVGHFEDCVDGRARTVAEKVLISSVNGMPVLWQSQLRLYRQSIANENQQSSANGSQRSSASGGSQRSSANGSQRSSAIGPGNHQQQANNPPLVDPPQDPLTEAPPDQEDQEELLKTILDEQREPEYQQQQEPEYQQQQELHPLTRERLEANRIQREANCRSIGFCDIRVDAPNTVEGGSRPGYHPLKPHSGECKGGVCLNCSWSARYIFKGRDGTVQRICKRPNQNPCTQYESKPVNLVERPSSVTWTYICK